VFRKNSSLLRRRLLETLAKSPDIEATRVYLLRKMSPARTVGQISHLEMTWESVLRVCVLSRELSWRDLVERR